MKRVALWLITEIGEGSEFTKEDLRHAFPGVAQVDRRLRDLRSFDWQIDTNREDPALGPHQQRFVKGGVPVWEPGRAGQRSRGTIAIGATKRRQVISADGNMCRSCGITPGELYAGTYETAQLDIARRKVAGPDGSTRIELVTECNRCRVGGRELVADLPKLLGAIDHLSAPNRRLLAGWMEQDARKFSEVEQIWSEYRSLPGESRAEVRTQLGLG
jgi:hypothetical protein